MKKAIVTIVMTVAMTASAIVPTFAAVKEPANLEQYLTSVDDVSKVRIYESEDLDYETLTSRKENGSIIVEKITGICVNENGDGWLLYDNGTELSGDYISYYNVKDCATGKAIKVGDTVTTYCVYNADNDYDDDIIYRFDVVR